MAKDSAVAERPFKFPKLSFPPRTGQVVRPLGDRVVVEREDAEDVSKGGIVIPDAAQHKPQRGVVIAIGEGKLLDDGSRATPLVKVGQRVLFTNYGPESVKLGDDELLLMREEDILAVLE